MYKGEGLDEGIHERAVLRACPDKDDQEHDVKQPRLDRHRAYAGVLSDALFCAVILEVGAIHKKAGDDGHGREDVHCEG